MTGMVRSFEELVDEGAAAPVDGWDFSWLEGRATEERPSWGYQRLLASRLARASAVLDLQTGGGEVVAGAADLAGGAPPLVAATESWGPNLARASERLRPLGGAVVAAADEGPLPFADGVFDLVSCRHPTTVPWGGVARVLRPGGTYLAQHVGPASVFELIEFFLGPQPAARGERRPDDEAAAARTAGLEVVDLRSERLRMEFFDVGAVVYLLRKVVWLVPGFEVEAHRGRLRELHQRIASDGPFVAHASRTLIEARKPGR